jgi:hypothetical protein
MHDGHLFRSRATCVALEHERAVANRLRALQAGFGRFDALTTRLWTLEVSAWLRTTIRRTCRAVWRVCVQGKEDVRPVPRLAADGSQVGRQSPFPEPPRRRRNGLSHRRPRPQSPCDEALQPWAPGEEYLPRKSATAASARVRGLLKAAAMRRQVV